MFDLIFNSPLFDGEIFGLIDNGILAVLALLGIDLDRRLGGDGIYGALYGALIGNTLSDFVGAITDPVLRDNALGITTGCLEVLVLVYIGLFIYDKYIRGSRFTRSSKTKSEIIQDLAEIQKIADLSGLPIIDDDGNQVRYSSLEDEWLKKKPDYEWLKKKSH
tara:strand:+ start:15612 stop:16100 length:489 start_codon:yes stop_codon:yes gene_type:complete